MSQPDRPLQDVRLYCTTNEDHPLKLVDVVELFHRELRERGLQQEWFCRNRKPGPFRSTVVDGVRVFVPPWSNRFGAIGKLVCHGLYYGLDAALLLRFLWKPVDIIQARDKYVAAVIGLLVARARGRLFTVWLSYPFPEHEIDEAQTLTGPRRLFKRISGAVGTVALYRIAMSRADHCFVQSEQMKLELHQNHGIALERMTAVPMGVPARMARFASTNERGRDPRLSSDDGHEPTVIYLGALDKVRGLDTMIDAFIAVARRRERVRFMLVGDALDANDTASLRERVNDSGLSARFEFTGRLPIEEAWARVAAAHIGVSPLQTTRVLRVASPTKLVEYLALGKPVVANHHPDQSLVLRESGAGVCVAWSTEDFADGIVRLLDSPAGARDMGARGRQWVLANRRYDRLADQVARQYSSLLDGRG